jgi:hypothetical protein
MSSGSSEVGDPPALPPGDDHRTVSDEVAPDGTTERVTAQDAVFVVVGLGAIVGGAAFRGARRVTEVAMRNVPRAPQPIGATVVSLAARGRDVTTTAVDLVRGIAEGVARDFTRQPSFVELVDDLVELVLPGAIDRALPVVMDKLAAEPETVRALVFSQSTGVAGEIVATVRTGVKAGDAAVDRSIRFWRARRRQETPMVAQLSLEPGTP